MQKKKMRIVDQMIRQVLLGRVMMVMGSDPKGGVLAEEMEARKF